MPGLSGLELLQRIKKINNDVEFIILSGYGEFTFAQEAMQAGVRHYLLKPCNENQIIESVRQVMDDLAQKKAFRSSEVSMHYLSNPMILNIINEGVSLKTDQNASDFSSVYHTYRKFIDFQQEAYELCYLYFVDESAMQEILQTILDFKKEFAPSIPFHIIYVHQTLLFFFQSFHYDYKDLDDYLSHLKPVGQSIAYVYERVSYPNLTGLLNKMLLRIKRYDTIYYANGKEFISICNYRNIICSMEIYTSGMYQNTPKASENLSSLLDLFSQISDPLFLKQLVSSVMMLSSSKTTIFSSLDATEFLLKINTLNTCQEILDAVIPKISTIYQQHHASPASGNLSARIDEYVRNNLSDTNLSLKWIAENYLYMNVDYVSRRFLKETGTKFSHYLTELRISKAKELLAINGCDKIQSIAESVGCGNNPQYFSQLFKKATGITPSNYMKYISGGIQNDK